MASSGAKTSQTSPPAGTGHVPGLGEAFSINFGTGQGVYTYKLPLPDGVARHTPRLALEYAHGVAHGPFGQGWRLPSRTLVRRLDFGVPDEGVAERFLDGGDEIVPLGGGVFGALAERAFARYTRAGDGWRIEERTGHVHELGLTAAARVADPAHPDRPHEWLLERSVDPCGNVLTFTWRTDNGMPYLAEVRYAAYAVRFTYQVRPDVRLDGRAGYLRQRRLRCESIELFLDPGPGERRIRSWRFAYTQAAGSGISLLSSIHLVSHGAAPDGSGDVRRSPATFVYTEAARPGPAGELEIDRAVDYMPAPDGPHPPPLTDGDTALVVLDAAPLPGVLRTANGAQFYWPNLGDGRWGAPRPVRTAPGVPSFARAGLAFVDMDASGTADLLVAAGSRLPGYYENGGREGFTRFVAFPRGRRAAPAWTTGKVRLSDADADGRIDALMSQPRSFAVWLNQGERGWSDPVLAPAGDGDDRPDVDFADPLVLLADVTGDGLDDLVRVRSGRVEYWPGLGRGRFGARRLVRNSPRLRDVSRDPQSVLLLDVDGDGCADLVRVTPDGVEVFLNQNGEAFTSRILIDGVPPAIPGTVRAVNMRGRAGSGLLWNAPRGGRVACVALDLGGQQPAYLLTRIDNGSGLVSEIFYRSAVEDYRSDREGGTTWTTHFPFPYLVVAGTKETDRVSGRTSEVRYRYHEGHFERGLRQFQGFRRTERIEVGDESRPGTLTVFHFVMGEERQPGRGPEHAALNGLLQRTEVYGLDGSPDKQRPYRIEETEYELQALGVLPDGRRRGFVFARRHRLEDRERTSDRRGEEKTFTYDAFGNVTREVLRGYGERGGAAQAERGQVTEVAYAQAASRYLVDRASRILVRDEGGVLLSETRRYYDGPDFVGLPLGQAARGLLSREEQLVLPKADFDVVYAGMDATALGFVVATDVDGEPAVFANAERHTYDGRGLRVADRDAVGHDTRFTHDASGLFRTALITTAGTTHFEYDRAVGQPARVVYPDGAETRYAYDAQGRAVATALPGESIDDPPARYRYDDSAIPHSRTGRFRPRAAPEDEAVAVTYFDGHGKEFQQRAQVGPGQFVVSGLRIATPWGDLKQEFEPTFAASAAFALPATAWRASRQVFYDALGRAVRTVNYNGGVSTAEYRVFEVTTRDANDNDGSPENVARGQFDTPHRERFDVLRHLTAVDDDLGGGRVRTTSYLTGVQGELRQASDGRGVVATYEYDRRGNRLRIRHREAGERRLWYDARGQVVRTIDANGNDLRAEIDERNRLRRLTAGATVLEAYVYDDPARNGIGRVCEVTYRGGRQEFDYDRAGRLVRHTYHFDGEAAAQTLGYTYDRLGREIALTHTDGTTFRRALTANGWIRAIPGILDEVAYDPRGLPSRLRYANGVVCETTYTAGPGRVRTHTTRAPGGQVLEQVTYTYDQMEMLLASHDAAPGGAGERSYAYDPLSQLTRATSDEAGAAVTRQYDYANFMNLARFGEAGRTLHYDDPAHPDRLAGLTPDGGGRVDTPHDPNGNLLGLPGKTFAWNAKNELDRFRRGDGLTAEYRYDHKGLRASKTVTEAGGGITRTVFVGEDAEVRNAQASHFVRLGAVRVAIVAGGVTRFVHPDPLGSTAFFTDAAGTRIAAIAYRPFGNVATSSGAVDPRTFGVHPFDAESGLVYMRRRYYAPEIGRFLTPDPLALYRPSQSLHNPKALHPYAYVANDPLNKTDLTGLSFWSVVGAIVGVIVAIAVVALVVMTGGLAGVLLGAALAIGLVAVSYVVASETAGTAFGEFMRGFMIGFNAGLNAALAIAIFGPFIGVALGVINFLAAFDSIANSGIYQGILGWASWLMPMSWLATGVGLVVFLLNVVPALVTLNQVEAVQIRSLSLDWRTGTIVMEGGWVFLPGFRGGYSLGNFAYITPGSGVRDHETGHTLSNAAFGSIFHYIGAIDENAIQNTPANAYSERIADSHDPNGPAGRVGAGEDPIIPMWV